MLGNHIYKMNKLIRALFAIAIVAAPLLAITSLVSAAPSATLSLSPSSKSVTKGATLTVDIFEDSGTEPVNAVEADLTYPSSLLTYKSITSSTACGIEAPSSGGGGSVQVVRGCGTPPNGVTGSQLVATVTFTAANAGTASITFKSSSRVVSSNTNTNILSGTTGGSYTITSPPTPPPPTSPPPVSPTSPPPSSTPPSSPTPPPSSSGSTKKTSPSPSPSKKPSASKLSISDVSVSNVGINTVTISWTTSAAATSEVDYGLSSGKYILSAHSGKSVKAHKVVLNTSLLVPGTEYHFVVKSVDGTGHTATSSDQTFTTKGATLAITVVDHNKKPVKGAKVTIGKVSGTTDKNGHVTLSGLPVGKTTAVIEYNGKKTNASITVNRITSEDAAPQPVTLIIERTGNHTAAIAIIVLALLAIAAVFFVSRRGGGDGGIKDVRSFMDDHKDHHESGAAGGGNSGSSESSSSSAPTPTIVKPTIPPRT